MSRTIASDVIAELGDLHYGRKRIQPASRDIRAFYARARNALKFPLKEFSRDEIALIANAFAQTIREQTYTCYACAILPDHVHVIIRKHKHRAEDMIAHLQSASRDVLRSSGSRTANHPIWGGPGWKVFLDCPDDVHRTIPYIRKNPLKLRRPAQRWEFVTAYDNWPMHAGHNPNSPYARAIRQMYPGRYE